MLTILSLFDGMSCGQIALNRVGISDYTYYASEIDKDSMSVTMANYPNTIQIGDVRCVEHDTLPQIDLMIGGSPCQSFSFIGKMKGMATSSGIEILSLDQYLEYKANGFEFDGQSYLFWEYVRLLTELKPKYFLLENVIMSKKWQDVISKILGVECIEINSSLVSAQNRRRLYWTNIPLHEPLNDLGITLEDIIETPSVYKLCKISSRYVPSNIPKFVDPYNCKSITSGKSTTLRTNISNGNMWVRTDVGYRNLTVSECEKLQTVPVGYCSNVSESKAKKMLGNGWTVDVIAHILKNILI